MKVCIIGSTGHINYVFNGLQQTPQARLVGAAKGSPGETTDRLLAQDSRFDIRPQIFDDYRDMLDRLRPDIVAIACHFGDHAKIAVEALQRGIHVFVEKPVATTLQDLAKVREAYAKSGVHLAAMFGIVHMKSGQPAPFFSNFTDHGGLFPNGFWAIFTTMILVNFSFQGTELVGVAAGESREPEKTVPIALRNTVWRILIFFVLAIFVLAGLFPWEKAGVVESPFVVVFDNIGIPYAADIMNFVIITAVLSVANSGLYATSRVLWSMSRQGMVTPFFSKLSKRGVPINALIASIAIGCLSLLCSVYAEDTVYVWLTAIAGFGAVTVWASIALSSYLGRKAFLREGGDVRDLKYRTPLYPFVPLAAFILNMAIIVGLAFIPDQRIALYCGIPFLLVCYAYYHLVAKKRIHLQRTEEEVELKAAK